MLRIQEKEINFTTTSLAALGSTFFFFFFFWESTKTRKNEGTSICVDSFFTRTFLSPVLATKRFGRDSFTPCLQEPIRPFVSNLANHFDAFVKQVHCRKFFFFFFFFFPFPQFGLSNDKRISNFIGQCAVESDMFRVAIEYASGTAYNFRKDLGNTQPGDGPRFKGRGLIQLTGRANYKDQQGSRFKSCVCC